MSKLAEHVMQEKLPRENRGLPSLNLDECQRLSIPTDWDICEVFGDILMCERADENAEGEVLRDGIWLRQDITQNLWRIVKVLKKGPKATDYVQVGDYLMIPGDRGLTMFKDRQKLVFVNEERVFCKVTPRD